MVTISAGRLRRILEVQPDEHATCIGYGKTKPTCGCLVAAASRHEANQYIAEISASLSDGVRPRGLVNELEDLAHLLHCKRWHQYQAAPKAQKWKLALDEYLARAREDTTLERRTEPRQSRGARNTRTTSRESTTTTEVAATTAVETLTQVNRELVEQLRLFTAMYSQLQARTAGAAPRRQQRPVASDSESSEDEDDDDNDDDSEHDSSDNDDEQPRRSGRARAPSPPATFVRSDSPSPSGASSSSRSDGTTSSSTARECGICLEPVSRRSNDNWSCTTCRQQTHLECFTEWMVSNNGQNVTCPYCRSAA